MKEKNTNLFDPKTIMESQVSVNCFNKKDVSVNCSCASSDCDFGFAFNDSKFSDRVLKIEIISGLSEETKSDGEGCNRTRKRKREDTGKENGPLIVSFKMRKLWQWLKNHTLGDEGVANNDASWSMDCSTVLRVKTIHISSPILAAKSLFFYKLFSNGMRETEQRDITLRVNASEEAALMEILKFMYSNTLSVTTTPTLVDVLMAADKFEVHSCMRYCGRRLRDLPMTIEFALLYLELPSSVLMAEAVRPLIDAAKDYLVAQYKDFDKFQEKVLKLPLAGIEAVLSSDDLQVASEDSIFDFILKWAEVHYPKLEDRREVLGSRLSRLIRFPFMTCRKLEQVLTCTDFADNLLSKAVIEALFFKAEAPHRQRIRAAKDSTFTYRGFVERQYKLRPVKVLQFEFPRQQCVVYLDLKRDACANLFPLGRVYSQSFDFGGQYFYLTAHCLIDQQSTFHHFGLFLGMRQQKKRDSVSLAVDFEFAARSKPTEKYLSKCKANYTFTSEKEIGVRNVFGIPWETFIAEDSLYFINDTLHLRAELTIEH